MLNPARFVAVGDGLSAGAGDFGLSEELQPFSYPALVARQLGAAFRQPIFGAPGIGPVIGFRGLPVRLPQPMQSKVLDPFPPTAPFSNASVPGTKLADALTRRPTLPLVHRSDELQTAINLILGPPDIASRTGSPLQTQIEYAASQRPTLVLVALGYQDVLDAVFRADSGWLPDDVSFRIDYANILVPFGRVQSTIVTATIPDPGLTAGLTPVAAAAPIVKTDPAALATLFGLGADDCLTPAGLFEAGWRVMSRTEGPLPAGSVVPGAVASRIGARVRSLNAQIRAVAAEQGAIVFDLHDIFARWRRRGVSVGGRHLTSDYLGGLFSLNGVYPGVVGHGIIANGLLATLDATCGSSHAPLDLETLAAVDPVAQYRRAGGPVITTADLAATRSSGKPEPPPSQRVTSAPRPGRLTLPPGLAIELPLDTDASCFGYALLAAHSTGARGSAVDGMNTLFGGPALCGGHLRGAIRICFAPPVDDVSHFEVTHGDGLIGNDTVMAAPQLFRLSATGNAVFDVAGLVSSGDLDLATGEVTNLSYTVRLAGSALSALASVNPEPMTTVVRFMGRDGSATAQFVQREDGGLDFTFSGVTSRSLHNGSRAEPLRVPLPFAGPAMEFASIPAAASALHACLRISTRPPEAASIGREPPDIPTNAVREYTVFARGTAVGDQLSLNVPALGRAAAGRSQLSGRLIVQFGERVRDSVPVVIVAAPPGGLLTQPARRLTADALPGGAAPGLIGHDDVLQFAHAAYSRRGVRLVGDPGACAIGTIDLKSGRLLGHLVYRGFVVQDLMRAMMALEPRLQQSSFVFRGPASFYRDASGQTVFEFDAAARLDCPEGYRFPRPDLQSTFTVGQRWALDLRLRVEAMDGLAPEPSNRSGGARDLVASNGQRFSYSYSIPTYPAGQPAAFEYVNETTGGAFRLGSLIWASFGNTDAGGPGDCEIVTFTGVGLWSFDPDRAHFATVQISTAPELPYVSILIDGGLASNVDTKPARPLRPVTDVATA